MVLVDEFRFTVLAEPVNVSDNFSAPDCVIAAPEIMFSVVAAPPPTSGRCSTAPWMALVATT